MDPVIAASLKEAASIGKSKFNKFVVSRIQNASKPLSDVILFTFTSKPSTGLRRSTEKLENSKANTGLIARMFMSLQTRPSTNIDDFFKYENQCEPPSLSVQGKLRIGTKSDILNCLPGMPDTKEASVVVSWLQ